MSLLKNLKIVSTPLKLEQTPQQSRRDKLSVKLIEQMHMAQAELKGSVYERMKSVWSTDQNGDRQNVQRAAKLRKWYAKEVSGVVILRVFYGARPLELAKGKSAVEVESLEKLPAVLDTLAQAVKAGELDTEIATVAKERVPKKKVKAS